ncbi:hypothetical protein ACIGZH_01735 [Streptomyces sp. NPDC058319]|uniref:hypothetical protein n=1 Tax=unclassified Streptomyces TaxID=2593676 RepID=UPI0036E98E22
MSTTYWTWTLTFDEPGTGNRITSQGEVLAPADATAESVRQQLYPGITAELRRRYGAGYRVEALAPSCRIERQ